MQKKKEKLSPQDQAFKDIQETLRFLKMHKRPRYEQAVKLLIRDNIILNNQIEELKNGRNNSEAGRIITNPNG